MVGDLDSSYDLHAQLKTTTTTKKDLFMPTNLVIGLEDLLSNNIEDALSKIKQTQELKHRSENILKNVLSNVHGNAPKRKQYVAEAHKNVYDFFEEFYKKKKEILKKVNLDCTGNTRYFLKEVSLFINASSLRLNCKN
jgi:hypothetical protein